MGSLFGDMGFDDIPDGFTRGSYQLIMEVAPGKKDEKSEEPRVSYMLTFEIDEDKHPDMFGMYPGALFLNTYPEMTKEKYAKLPKELSKEERAEGKTDQKMVALSIKAVRRLLQGMGIPQSDWDDKDLTDFDGKKIVANLYPDKETQEPRVDGRTIKRASKADSRGEVTSFDDLGTNLN